MFGPLKAFWVGFCVNKCVPKLLWCSILMKIQLEIMIGVCLCVYFLCLNENKTIDGICGNIWNLRQFLLFQFVLLIVFFFQLDSSNWYNANGNPRYHAAYMYIHTDPAHVTSKWTLEIRRPMLWTFSQTTLKTCLKSLFFFIFILIPPWK